jgi:DNA-damage-inducible protein J
MSDTTNISIRMDKTLKDQAEQLFAEMGMNMTTAFTVFVRQTLRLGRIPFEISVQSDPFFNDYNQQLLLEAINSLKENKGVEHKLIEA